MNEIILKSQISYFNTCSEFAKEFNLGSQDLVLTNEYIYQPYFGHLGLNKTRSNRIDLNIFSCKFFGKGFCKPYKPGL